MFERKRKKKLEGVMVDLNYSDEIPKVTFEDPFEIKLFEKNPRKNDPTVKKLALLLCMNGQRTPINVWIHNKTVYKGNTTLKAIRFITKLSWDEYKKFIQPLIKAKKNPVHINKVMVMWHKFDGQIKSDQDIKEYAISDNVTSEWATWDEDLLEEILQIETKDIELLSLATGFSEDELKNLSLMPDLEKISKIQKSKAVYSSIIRLDCPGKIREDLIDWLEEELPDNGFKDVKII